MNAWFIQPNTPEIKETCAKVATNVIKIYVPLRSQVLEWQSMEQPKQVWQHLYIRKLALTVIHSKELPVSCSDL